MSTFTRDASRLVCAMKGDGCKKRRRRCCQKTDADSARPASMASPESPARVATSPLKNCLALAFFSAFLERISLHVECRRQSLCWKERTGFKHHMTWKVNRCWRKAQPSSSPYKITRGNLLLILLCTSSSGRLLDSRIRHL